MTRPTVLALVLLALVVGVTATAEPGGPGVALAPTLVTEGTTPATEVEGFASHARSEGERGTAWGLSSLQWAPVPTFGVKLVVPFAIREPLDGPTVAGMGDLGLMLKATPVLDSEAQLALGGGVLLTVPTGSERRGLGGELAVTPFLVAGKAWGALSLQADLFYGWQVNQPRSLEPEEEGGERVRPDRRQSLIANLAAGYVPVERLTLILELNTVTVIRGDEALRERVQLYVTPGVAVDVAEAWNLRAGVQLPVTRARTVDANVIFLVTRSF